MEKLSDPLENYYKLCPKCDYIAFNETQLYCPICKEELVKYNSANLNAFFGYERGKINSTEEIRQNEDYNIDLYLLESKQSLNEEVIGELSKKYNLSHDDGIKLQSIQDSFTDFIKDIFLEIYGEVP